MKPGDIIVGTAKHNRGVRMECTRVKGKRAWARLVNYGASEHAINPKFYAVEHPQEDLFGPERKTS